MSWITPKPCDCGSNNLGEQWFYDPVNELTHLRIEDVIQVTSI